MANGKPVVEQRLAKVSSKTLKQYKAELDQVVNILRIDDQNVTFLGQMTKMSNLIISTVEMGEGSGAQV